MKQHDMAIINLIQLSVLVFSAEGIITGWNKAAELLYGWSAKQALGQNLCQLLRCNGSSDIASVLGSLQSSTQQLQVQRFNASGELKLINISWSCRYDDAGQLLDIIESGRDVTQSQQVQDELRQSELRYRTMFDSMSVGCFEIDTSALNQIFIQLRAQGVTDLVMHAQQNPDFLADAMQASRVVKVNAEAMRIFKASQPEQLLGPVIHYWNKDNSDTFCNSINAGYQRHSKYDAETFMLVLDGSRVDVQFSMFASPALRDSGTVFISLVDITQRKQAERELMKSEFKFRTLFEASAISFQQLDVSRQTQLFRALKAQGVTDLKAYIDEHPEFVQQAMDAVWIAEANPYTLTLYGAKTKSEILGPVTPYWIPGQCDTFRRSIEAGYRGETGYQAETKIRRLDGKVIDILFASASTATLRELGLVVLTIVDITDWVADRNQRDNFRDELAHAARVSMLGELTASIAHEVNQPLAAIATNGETGLRWLNRQEPDLNKAQDLMQRMVNDAYRAADIISRIRAMASHTKVEPQLIDLNACVEESVLFLQYELRSQRIQLELDLEPGLPPLLADRTQLQQVLINILVNAMQALSGKTISMPKTMPIIHIQSLWLNQNHLQLQVSDNGPGIMPEHLPHIFDSFFTTKSAGMGMGLLICRSIIEALGGTIEAKNNENGAGACFVLLLPLN